MTHARPHSRRCLAALVTVLLLASACGSKVSDEPAPEGGEQEESAAPAEVETADEQEPGPAGHAPLTGEALADEAVVDELADRPAVAVKVPNDPRARPHTGLEGADVVYEEETEGGVTRFAAVFHSRWPDVVGNVRSARAIDVELVSPYDGVFVYSGARDEVQAIIDAAGLTRVTEGGAGFYRDGQRPSPHNLYVRLPEAAAAVDAPPADAAPWRFDAEPPEGGRPVAGRVAVPVSRSATAGWEYDEAAGRFRRDQDGQPHTVTGEGRIGAANVVVLDVEVTGRDAKGAPVYDLTGDGDALLLRDGRGYGVRWSKAGRDAPLELRDAADEAVLAPGPTWVVLTYADRLSAIELG